MKPELRPPAPGLKSSLNRPLHQGAATSVKLAAPETARKEAEMHALVVRVTIHNADRTREVLNSQVVPQVSGAPGFKQGYWTWSTGGGELNGLWMIIFESGENARAAGGRAGGRARAARRRGWPRGGADAGACC